MLRLPVVLGHIGNKNPTFIHKEEPILCRELTPNWVGIRVAKIPLCFGLFLQLQKVPLPSPLSRHI